jgi:hypothetical protein
MLPFRAHRKPIDTAHSGAVGQELRFGRSKDGALTASQNPAKKEGGHSEMFEMARRFSILGAVVLFLIGCQTDVVSGPVTDVYKARGHEISKSPTNLNRTGYIAYETSPSTFDVKTSLAECGVSEGALVLEFADLPVQKTKDKSDFGFELVASILKYVNLTASFENTKEITVSSDSMKISAFENDVVAQRAILDMVETSDPAQLSGACKAMLEGDGLIIKEMGSMENPKIDEVKTKSGELVADASQISDELGLKGKLAAGSSTERNVIYSGTLYVSYLAVQFDAAADTLGEAPASLQRNFEDALARGRVTWN